jgi:GNAT superfamily N-acetyltransferase
MIRYLKRNYQELSREDLVSLRRLTLRGYDESGFQKLLDGRWGNLETTKFVIAVDTKSGRYVGWTALIALRSGPRRKIGTFVSWKYRRRGIGTKLVEKGMEFAKAEKAQCFMHDDISDAFYRKFGAKREREDPDGWTGRSVFTLKV